MPRIPSEDNERMSLRVAAADKSLLMRAAAMDHTNLTEFVIRSALASAKAVLDANEQKQLTERESLKVLALLEDPPAPNERLLAAARALKSAT